MYILGEAAGKASASASAVGAGKVQINGNVVKAIANAVKNKKGTRVTKKVCIRAKNGQFLAIQRNKKIVKATTRRCTSKEAFVISGDKVYSPHYKTYLSCQPNGKLEGNRKKAASWERIQRRSAGGKSFSLRCLAHGKKYIVAEGGGGKIVNANRPRVGSWEKFTAVPAP